MIDQARRNALAIYICFAVLISGVTTLQAQAEDPPEKKPLRTLLQGVGKTESAPHGDGNVYAPDVTLDHGLWRMWYGGQGLDGHDRIHLAESKDGTDWVRRGVVVDVEVANHVNDPSVVKVRDDYFMYYTRAPGGVVDEIALATSRDGVTWVPKGVVLKAGQKGEWDSLLVGRPAVLHEDGVFKMWFDGRRDLTPGPLSKGAVTSPSSGRSVGYATSKDGVHWTKYAANPVMGNDAGGIDVKPLGMGYVMVYESHVGTNIATSDDGITWKNRGRWVPLSGGKIDRHGQVTPMLHQDKTSGSWRLYLGGASALSWNHNSIVEVLIPADQIGRLSEKQSVKP